MLQNQINFEIDPIFKVTLHMCHVSFIGDHLSHTSVTILRINVLGPGTILPVTKSGNFTVQSDSPWLVQIGGVSYS